MATTPIPSGVSGLTQRTSINANMVQAYKDMQTQDAVKFSTAGGPAFTGAPSPVIVAYANGQKFQATFLADGTTGSNTINVCSLGAKSLKQYDSNGTKLPAIIKNGMIADIRYDGTDFVVLNPLPAILRQIQPVVAVVAANALTVGLFPTQLDFRDSTVASGTVNTRTVSATISAAVPAGATLGTLGSWIVARLAILALDVAGTVEIGVVNINGSINLDETTLISTTALSTSSDSAGVVYSTTARSNVPFRVVGFVDMSEATAGQWATSPQLIQGIGGQALASLSSVGYAQTWQAVTRTSGTTYYNTTGKPIMLNVYIASYSGTTGITSISINAGGAVQIAAGGNSGGVTSAAGSIMIPIGASYVLADSSVSSRNTWELR